MALDIVGCLYSVTVAAGGVIGYLKAGSLPSLGAGLVFGGVLGAGAYMNSQDPPRPLLQLSTALVLAALMGIRWSKSGKFMPAGVVCVLSVGAVAYNLTFYNKYLYHQKQSVPIE